MKTPPFNNLGKKYLIENCQKISINKILRSAKKNAVQAIIQGQAEIEGQKIQITTKQLHHGGDRMWFKCPICEGVVGIIYKHPLLEIIGCRKCLNLDYKCRRFKGMVEIMDK